MFLPYLIGLFIYQAQANKDTTAATSPVTVTQSSDSTHFNVTNITITTTQKSWSFANAESEEYVMAGNKLVLDCGSYEPFKVEYTWKTTSGDFTGAEQYALEDNGRKLLINEVKYSDRKTFVCIVSNQNNTVVKSITLRVRDPLGALWPCLGILAESLVLCMVIWCFEKSWIKTESSEDTFER